MSEKKTWELTENERKKKQDTLLYNTFIVQQRKNFEKIINFINSIVNDLMEEGKLSEYIEVRARIKSAESALKNDPVKALDDSFGMEIITATNEETETIIKEIQYFMTSIKAKEKNLDKDNGYKAKHRTMVLKHDKMNLVNIEEEQFEEIPMIEIQFKTFETVIKCARGTANHEAYKGEKPTEIKQKYNNGEYNSYKSKNDFFNVPIMWVSKNRKNEIINNRRNTKKNISIFSVGHRK